MTKLEKTMKNGVAESIECLRSICVDTDQKAADRIAAAKALYEFAKKSDNKTQETVSVVLENVPNEFLA